MVVKSTLYFCEPTLKKHSDSFSLIFFSNVADTLYEEMNQLKNNKAGGGFRCVENDRKE